jgi:hypothetical protein
MPQLNIPQSRVFSSFAEHKAAASAESKAAASAEPEDADPVELLPMLVDRFYIKSSKFNKDAPAEDSLYLWGCLVKSWATGLNHLPDKAPDDPIEPKPATGDDLRKLLDKLGIEYDMPERITRVVFSQSTDDTLSIRLPARGPVLSREKAFSTGNNGYQLPAFYAQFFGPLKPLGTDKDSSMYVHTLRVGEYSMNNCA